MLLFRSCPTSCWFGLCSLVPHKNPSNLKHNRNSIMSTTEKEEAKGIGRVHGWQYVASLLVVFL